MKRIHFFDNSKQTRQFWSLTCSAVIIGLAWGEYMELIRPIDKMFCGILIACATIVIYVTCLEICLENNKVAEMK